MNKIHLCVLFGGKSTEYEVSLVSAASVLRNLNKDKYDIIMLGITKEGRWLLYEGDYNSIENGSWIHGRTSEAIISPDCTYSGIVLAETGERIKIDAAFPVIHGAYGEDGSMQGLLKLAGIKVIGADIMASCTGYDKAVSKIIFGNAGIPQSDYEVYLSQDFRDMDQALKKIENRFKKYPIFIKPANTGSSVGISKAHSRLELVKAIENALIYDNKLVLEEYINCRELETAVLGNEFPTAACVGEVVPSKEFYDYEAKYQDDNVKIIIPAVINEDIANTIRNYAVKAFAALGCRGLARADFFLCKDSGRIYINELNTMPGFTNVSMYPKLWEASGISYSELLDKLIELAFL